MEENLSIIREIHQQTGEKGNDIRTYSPLTLAYIGDAAYEIVIRTLIVEKKGQQAVHALHKQTTRIVCASAQAAIVEAIQDVMTGEGAGYLPTWKEQQNQFFCQEYEPGGLSKSHRVRGCMRISVSAGRDCPHCGAGEDRAGQTRSLFKTLKAWMGAKDVHRK